MAEEYRKYGIDVVDLGLITTDMSYFGSFKYGYDLSVMISASHNPPEYNGLKFVKKGAIAVSGESGIYEIRDWAVSDKTLPDYSGGEGKLSAKDLYDEWIDYCLGQVEVAEIKPYKAVIDAGNGMASVLFERMKGKLPLTIVPLFFKLDGTFPNHIPNPLKPENVVDLQKKVKDEHADFGVAFDGDGDRIAFVDETGKYITGTITTAMIAEMLLRKHPGEMIMYNAVCGRVVPETIKKYGGKSRRVRVGHTLIKEAMHKYKALFCGEHSGHYFFRSTANAESALLTLLYIAQLMTVRQQPLSKLVEEYDKFPSIPETNFEVQDKDGVMKALEKAYKTKAESTDWLDGVSIWFKDGWVNVRPSNTQPLLRLNIEADNQEILDRMEQEFVAKIRELGGKPSQE
jgi:phosphomannomutase